MPRGRGRGNRRRGVLGFLRPALLFLLVRADNHGYSLLDQLAEFGFNTDQVDPSLIYRILREMEDDGWVSSYLGKESLGPQRRIYKILPEGEEYLEMLIHGLRRRRDEIDLLLKAYEQEKGK
jgi:PadR family transcriptional regulator PadR